MQLTHVIDALLDKLDVEYTQEELHEQYIAYHRALFDINDWTCISDSAKAKVNPIQIGTAIKTASKFITVNGFKPNSEGRFKINVIKHTSFVFEADKEYIDFNTYKLDENDQEIPVPVSEQLRAIIESGIPYTTLVFTGSKSVHVIPKLTEDVGAEVYEALHKATQMAMWNDQGLRFDPATKDASRWTRRPRGVNEKTGKYQILLDVKDRITLKEYETWLESKGVDWKEFAEQKNALYIHLTHSATAEATHKAIMKTIFKKKTNFGTHSRAMDAYAYFMAMRGAGVDQQEALAMGLTKFGHVPSKGGETTESILRAECNNVWKKPQHTVSAFAVTNLQKDEVERSRRVLDANPKEESLDDMLASVGVVDSAPDSAERDKRQFFREIENYVNVNNHIFRKDFDNPNKLNPTKIDKSHWKAKFSFSDEDYRMLEEYDGFVNKPSFLNYRTDVGGKYNLFARVNWVPTKGSWPDIEKLLRHHYGENEFDRCQFEEILDYYTVLIKYPEYKQQMRILWSKEQKTAKSAVAELDSYLFGDNWTKIRSNEMESDFNSIWVSMFMLNLDEPYFVKKDKMAKDLRDLITTPTVNLRKMQTDYEKVPFHAKFLVTTNDSNFMPFEKGDRRYWPRKSPIILEEDKDTKMMDRIKLQVPAFVYHLLYERKMKYPEPADETFWLPESVTKTNAFNLLVGDTESTLETAVKTVFENFFMQKAYEKCDSVLFKTEDINQRLEDLQRNAAIIGFKLSNYTQAEVNSVLRDNFGAIQPKSPVRPRKDDVFLVLAQDLDRESPARWWRMTNTFKSNPDDVFNLKM